MPLRLTISRRTLQQNAVEFKLRTGGEALQIPRDAVLGEVPSALAEMRAAIRARIKPEPFGAAPKQ